MSNLLTEINNRIDAQRMFYHRMFYDRNTHWLVTCDDWELCGLLQPRVTFGGLDPRLIIVKTTNCYERIYDHTTFHRLTTRVKHWSIDIDDLYDTDCF